MAELTTQDTSEQGLGDRRATDNGRSHERGSSVGAVMPMRLGMRFSRGLRFEQWVAIGRRVAERSDASLWWLGDWLIFGSRMYGAP